MSTPPPFQVGAAEAEALAYSGSMHLPSALTTLMALQHLRKNTPYLPV